MNTHLEVKTIEHKGIKVSFLVDYDNSSVSIVEPRPGQSFPWGVKQWMFSNRGLEYMDSWFHIMEAMQEAVRECKKALEKDLAEKTRFRDDKIIALVKPAKRHANKNIAR